MEDAGKDEAVCTRGCGLLNSAGQWRARSMASARPHSLTEALEPVPSAELDDPTPAEDAVGNAPLRLREAIDLTAASSIAYNASAGKSTDADEASHRMSVGIQEVETFWTG